MKTIVNTIFILSFILIGSQEKVDVNNIKNVQLYLVDTLCQNKDSYIYMNDVERNKFFKKYQYKKDIPVEKCIHYVDTINCKINKDPYLDKNDIINFDLIEYTLELSENGLKKMEKLNPNIHFGQPFILKLNEKILLTGRIWNIYSSMGCDRFYLWPEVYKENKIKLYFGGCGTNPFENNRKTE